MVHFANVIKAMLRQEERYMAVPGKNESVSGKSHRSATLRAMYKVVGLLGMDRELVIIAASHFDRYCGTRCGRKVLANSRRAELVGLSCFYLAQKMYGHEVLSAQEVADVFEGVHSHSPSEIENTEVNLLEALEWHVHPPTAVTFIRNIVNSIESEDSETAIEMTAVTDMAVMQVEMSFFDRRIALKRASVVAAAALVNALECLDVSNPWYVVPYLFLIENIALMEMEETRHDMNVIVTSQDIV